MMPATQTLSFDLTLADRDPSGLAAAMAGGSSLSATEFANRYGPDPARVASAMHVLAAAGLTAMPDCVLVKAGAVVSVAVID